MSRSSIRGAHEPRLFQRCTSDGWLAFPSGPKFPSSQPVFPAFCYVQRKRVEVYRTSAELSRSVAAARSFLRSPKDAQ